MCLVQRQGEMRDVVMHMEALPHAVPNVGSPRQEPLSTYWYMRIAIDVAVCASSWNFLVTLWEQSRWRSPWGHPISLIAPSLFFPTISYLLIFPLTSPALKLISASWGHLFVQKRVGRHLVRFWVCCFKDVRLVVMKGPKDRCSWQQVWWNPWHCEDLWREALPLLRRKLKGWWCHNFDEFIFITLGFYHFGLFLRHLLVEICYWRTWLPPRSGSCTVIEMSCVFRQSWSGPVLFS